MLVYHDVSLEPIGYTNFDFQSDITLFYDNSGAVANAKEPRSYKRRKYIERKYHLIREIVNKGDAKVSQIISEDNLVDSFIKGLT